MYFEIGPSLLSIVNKLCTLKSSIQCIKFVVVIPEFFTHFEKSLNFFNYLKNSKMLKLNDEFPKTISTM